MFEGKIKHWLGNYGFIARDDGSPDLFCHISAVTGGVEAGDRVEFQVATDMKTRKPIAAQVRVIK
jgi:cold shock CspA family protein